MLINPLQLFVIFLLMMLPSYVVCQDQSYISSSDSLLLRNSVEQAKVVLDEVVVPSGETKGDLYLRKNYLEIILKYKETYEEKLFADAKIKVDAILDSPKFTVASKKIYLHNFLTSFSKNILNNEDRRKYSDTGLFIAKSSIPEDTFFMVHFLFHRSLAYEAILMNEKAISDLELAEKLSTDFLEIDPNMLPKIFYKLGVLYKAKGGMMNKGYEYLKKSEEIFLNLDSPDSSYLAHVYGMLSDIAWDVRDYEKGMGYVKRYKILFDKIDLETNMDPVEIVELKYHLLYKEMQFYQAHQKEDALQVVKEAEKGFERYKDNPDIKLRMASIYNFMGELYVLELPKEAIPYYLKAMKTINTRSSSYFLQYFFNLGKATLYSGDANQCLVYSTELLEIAESVEDIRLPHFYFLKAFAYIKLNNFDNALEISNKVIHALDPQSKVDLIRHTGLKNFNGPSIAVNINLFSRMGLEFLKGFPDNESAINVANAIFQLGILEYGKSIKAAKVTNFTKSMYEQMVWGILSTQEYLKDGDLTVPEVISFSENTNEKYLWTNHKANNNPNLYFDDHLLEKESTIRSEVIKLKQQTQKDSSDGIQQSIFDLELQLEEIEMEKRGSNSSYYFFEEADFDFETFQMQIAEDVLVLKYELIMDSLFLFEITDDQVGVKQVGSGIDFSSYLGKLYESIANPLSNLDSLNDMLDQLGEVLLPEINEGIASLVIKADGKFNLIPFDLLRRNGRYILKDYDISYVTALGLYKNPNKQEKVRKALISAPSYHEAFNTEGLLAVRGAAFDLSGALEEARLIAKILPGKLLLEEKALKSSFVKEADNYDLLHFSMHSLLNDDYPELSNLSFYDGESDNKLYINELYGMRLNAHLAVLSACNTGVGKEETGDGIVSLNRAFTFAGVPSVVSSLWSAPDQASKDIMVSFYKYLKAGETKPQALRSAKLEYLENQQINNFRHPFYWAGFVIHGDPSPLKIEKGLSFNMLVLYVAIGLALLGLGYYFLKKFNIFQKA